MAGDSCLCAAAAGGQPDAAGVQPDRQRHRGALPRQGGVSRRLGLFLHLLLHHLAGHRRGERHHRRRLAAFRRPRSRRGAARLLVISALRVGGRCGALRRWRRRCRRLLSAHPHAARGDALRLAVLPRLCRRHTLLHPFLQRPLHPARHRRLGAAHALRTGYGRAQHRVRSAFHPRFSLGHRGRRRGHRLGASLWRGVGHPAYPPPRPALAPPP